MSTERPRGSAKRCRAEHPACEEGVVDNLAQSIGACEGSTKRYNRLFRERYLISGRFACGAGATYHATVCKGNLMNQPGGAIQTAFHATAACFISARAPESEHREAGERRPFMQTLPR